jgi:hypothetical protein
MYYSLSFLSKLLGRSYVELADAFETGGLVQIDGMTGFPCVHQQELMHLRAFRDYLRDAGQGDVNLYATPALSKTAMLLSLRKVEEYLPLRIQMHNEVFHVTGRDKLELAMSYGAWRHRRMGGSIHLPIRDLKEIYSWASPAEITWRDIRGVLEDQLALQYGENKPFRTGEPPHAATPEILVPARPELPVLDIAPVCLGELEAPARRKKVSQYIFPRLDTKYQTVPEDGTALHEALVQRAFSCADNMSSILFEERTGLMRACVPGNYQEENTQRLKGEALASRDAYRHGPIRELFPQNFRFDF